MNYPRNPQRRAQNWGNGGYGGNQGGYQQNGGGQNGGQYAANSGKARPNMEKRGPRDPDFKGPCNVELPDGSRMVLFVSVWHNQDGSLGLKFNHPNGPQQGRQGGYQQNGAYRQPQRHNGYQGGYEQPQQSNRAYEDGGAMSRARPIPPRSEEHTSELQSRLHLVCRLLLEKKK